MRVNELSRYRFHLAKPQRLCAMCRLWLRLGWMYDQQETGEKEIGHGSDGWCSLTTVYGGKRKPNTLHTCNMSAWNSMSDSCCRSAESVVRITAQSGLADTEGDSRRGQLSLRNTQWQRHITGSPRILTLLVMVTTSTSNISEVCKTMKIYRLPSCDNVYCGTRLHVSLETALFQLS
jgi:hypothetical protein